MAREGGPPVEFTTDFAELAGFFEEMRAGCRLEKLGGPPSRAMTILVGNKTKCITHFPWTAVRVRGDQRRKGPLARKRANPSPVPSFRSEFVLQCPFPQGRGRIPWLHFSSADV